MDKHPHRLHRPRCADKTTHQDNRCVFGVAFSSCLDFRSRLMFRPPNNCTCTGRRVCPQCWQMGAWPYPNPTYGLGEEIIRLRWIGEPLFHYILFAMPFVLLVLSSLLSSSVFVQFVTFRCNTTTVDLGLHPFPHPRHSKSAPSYRPRPLG